MWRMLFMVVSTLESQLLQANLCAVLVAESKTYQTKVFGEGVCRNFGEKFQIFQSDKAFTMQKQLSWLNTAQPW